MNAASFLESMGLGGISLSLELHIVSIAVFRFHGHLQSSVLHETGWIIGGEGVHLKLNDNEISTPIEALAVCDYYSTVWFRNKGVASDEESLPDYRVPPDWVKLDYWDRSQTEPFQNKLGAMGWNIVLQNREHLHHPDIVAMCHQRGWLQAPIHPK